MAVPYSSKQWWIGISVKCLLTVSVCVVLAQGFSVSRDSGGHDHPRHHRQHHRVHHQRRHHSHHPDPDAFRYESGDPLEVQALGESALREAAQLLYDADSDGAGGVPVFMKLLLWETEDGVLFQDAKSSVSRDGVTNFEHSLASCVAPDRVSADPSGSLELQFPARPLSRVSGLLDHGCWLVLALQDNKYVRDLRDAHLSLALYQLQPGHERRLLLERSLPEAAFVALDVTEAIRQSLNSSEVNDSGPRFLVDVTAQGKASVSAVVVLEVGGRERGPLLVQTKERLSDGSMRVWPEPPQHLVHSPSERQRRHADHHPSTTPATTTPVSTTPACSSADSTTESSDSEENIVRTAATAQGEAKSESGGTERPREYRHTHRHAADPSDPAETCHLVSWEVSVQELGWSFVIFPHKLPINLCVGRCPTPLLDKRYNGSTNAIARNLMKAQGKMYGVDGEIPDVQCVPIRFKKLALILETNGVFSLESCDDLSADRCGCH